METISERIAKLIKSNCTKQNIVASVINVTPSTINTWIKGNYHSIPSIHILPLADFFHVSIEYLLTGIEPEKEEIIQESKWDIFTDDDFNLLQRIKHLDWDGRQMVTATIIQEQRRQSEMSNGEKSAV